MRLQLTEVVFLHLLHLSVLLLCCLFSCNLLLCSLCLLSSHLGYLLLLLAQLAPDDGQTGNHLVIVSSLLLRRLVVAPLLFALLSLVTSFFALPRGCDDLELLNDQFLFFFGLFL